MYWRTIGVGVVLGLFAIGYGLYPRSDVLSPSLASSAYAADPAPAKPVKSLVFESLPTAPDYRLLSVSRAKVPGGWLVLFEPNAD